MVTISWSFTIDWGRNLILDYYTLSCFKFYKSPKLLGNSVNSVLFMFNVLNFLSLQNELGSFDNLVSDKFKTWREWSEPNCYGKDSIDVWYINNVLRELSLQKF